MTTTDDAKVAWSEAAAVPHVEAPALQPINVGSVDESTSPIRSKLQLTAIIIALYLAMFIAALDQAILATSIPVISASLHSASGYTWLGGAYLLADAASGPIWAKCSDIWGRKPALLTAVAIFSIASILAATSVSMRMLIAARALQGTGGGGLLCLTLITVSDLFSVRRRTLFIGGMEVMWALAGGMGPITGGALTQLVSWRWCFWINLPVTAITFVLILVFLDVHNPRTPLRSGLVAIDWIGTLSILGVVLLLLLGLDFGGVTFPWGSAKVICLIVFGALSIGLFIFSENRFARYPLVPMSMFTNRSTNATIIVAFCHGMSFIAGEYFVPLYWQGSRGASPLRSGVLILPLTLAEASMGLATGFILNHTGRYRELMWFGLALMSLGTGLYITFDRTTPIAVTAILFIISGGGAGFLFQTPIIAIHAAVSQADTATGTATIGFIRTVAAATSIVLGGVVFQNSMDNRAGELQRAGLNATMLEAFSGSKAAASTEIVRRLSDPSQVIAVEDAYAWSMRNMWIMYTCIAVVGLVASFFTKHMELSVEHTETRTGIEKMTDRRAVATESIPLAQSQ